MKKTVLAIHDFACFGKCSTTLVLPILSAAGFSTSVLPTALLSTHTGGYGTPWKKDLQNDMNEILKHWKTQNIQFDALYSGYVANLEQLHQIEACFYQYQDSFRLVDPVMGDHGSLYSSLPKELPLAMRSLCAQADVITPNMSEAYALMKEAFVPAPYHESELQRVCEKLAHFCKGDIILTSVGLFDGSYGNAIYHKENGDITMVVREQFPYHSHGTGDVFASSVLAGLLSGSNIDDAVEYASDFVLDVLKLSYEMGIDERMGLCFEPLLGKFAETLKLM